MDVVGIRYWFTLIRQACFWCFGVTSLAVLLYAAIVERSKRFLSLFAALLFVVLFTVRETGLAHIVYYLPGMDKFRHIAYMLSSAKWLAIVCAGFGFLRIAQAKSSSWHVVFFLIALAIVTAAFVLAEFAWIGAAQGAPPLQSTSMHLRSAAFVFLTLGAGLSVLLISMEHSRLVLVGVAILELLLYRLFLPFPTQVEPSARINFANAVVRTYQPERIWAEEAPRAVDFQASTGQKFEHDLENAFLSVDLCGGSPDNLLARSILITKDVQALMLAEGLFDHSSELTSAENISRVLPTFGCHAPKLRLLHHPIVVADAGRSCDGFGKVAGSLSSTNHYFLGRRCPIAEHYFLRRCCQILGQRELKRSGSGESIRIPR